MTFQSPRTQAPPAAWQVAPQHLDRGLAWNQAFDLWLESRASPNTRRAYRAAWDDFLASTPKLPWEIGKADVVKWTSDMRSRGFSRATIQQRLAALSSFFTYVTRVYTVLDADGDERPLHDNNPALAVPRPRVSPYGKARYLTAEEIRALLRAIPRNTLQGLRDYALFLAYLATGRRNPSPAARHLRAPCQEPRGS